MSNGAISVHKAIRTELENYIQSQYFGKSMLLLNAVQPELDKEGLLYKRPYIESSPAYKSSPDGIEKSDIPDWMKGYFKALINAGIGVYQNPYVHQVEALKAAVKGKNLFVSTGTGSGKTECFMWPLMAKLADEARNSPETWCNRGVRTIIMYPMNALVSDQISRLRRLIGDADNKFVGIFRNICGETVRRPQFGMYTGRTPYPGKEPEQSQDKMLEKTLKQLSFPKSERQRAYYNQLLSEGKIPAKSDMSAFLEGLHNGKHIPDDNDAELITRFEMQQFCPDILITNYSMLEYMLLRPIEAKIWNDTRKWLHEKEENHLLFIIDEAHMYRGSSGGEVALLIRRLFHKLGIRRDKVQFILTTASMPNNNDDDRNTVMKFARNLTADDGHSEFTYLTGERETIDGCVKFDIPFEKFSVIEVNNLEENEETKLSELAKFWDGVSGWTNSKDLNEICSWMYDHLIEYKPFNTLIRQCRGNAVSLEELAEQIFGKVAENTLQAVSVLLAVAALAKNHRGAVLFPARMHMLFKGLSGVYACTNPNCPHHHTYKGITIGKVLLDDGRFTCPDCHSIVYELYNDRRCGALYYKGYIRCDTNGVPEAPGYLWHYPGQITELMKEIHLFIPEPDYKPERGKHIHPCYLDITNGFINFQDDKWDGQEGVVKLYWSEFTAKGRPQVLTFETCPHCQHKFSSAQLTSFNTKGNQSFYNLIKSQFMMQPVVPGKEELPNQGKKVLLFSDSRQRAAKLARDMSDASDTTAVRQLFALAINDMEKSSGECSMDKLYDYFCLEVVKHHLSLFYGEDKDKLNEGCSKVKDNYQRSERRKREYEPKLTTNHAPKKMLEYIIRMFAGGYNTLYESAISWLEPTEDVLYDVMDSFEQNSVDITEEELLQAFNAWIIYICDRHTALGQTITDDVRKEVRRVYDGYGIKKNWTFPDKILTSMGYGKDNNTINMWTDVFNKHFLDSNQNSGRLYVDLTRIRPRLDTSHVWYRCEKCSEITPYPLKDFCPMCYRKTIRQMTEQDYQSLAFWRNPINDALKGKRITVIDTEEHTAQLSHIDQREDVWSKTETYELRFRDLVSDNETPIDILSSTTTMEVGIDIGSLVAVGLRNIPPMRENYQQRAGRAGRRGSSLSTIVTFCEDSPHDLLYWGNPVPMFRGDPRKPWIDVNSKKLLYRHMSMIAFQGYLSSKGNSLDMISAKVFLTENADDFTEYIRLLCNKKDNSCLPKNVVFDFDEFRKKVMGDLKAIQDKLDSHPELFATDDGFGHQKEKSMLDTLYEEGIIPTYSFPKNVVSTYISDSEGKVNYEVDRGIDIAIGEYAPGRSIVVDKKTFQIGGFYRPGSDKIKGLTFKPAEPYINDANYLKRIVKCSCGWFGLEADGDESCPFCRSKSLIQSKPILRPWGFAPKDAKQIPEAQLKEQYSSVAVPQYSTLPSSDGMKPIKDCRNIRMASRENQRIIMVNKGPYEQGFMVCSECGAAMPGEKSDVLKDILRPYRSKYVQNQKCSHRNTVNIDLGFDFITDMLVLEFYIDRTIIEADDPQNQWIKRAALSLAEALRLAVSKELDIEFSELIAGYRIRENDEGKYIDIFLYDALSSGAGYSVSLADNIETLLQKTEEILACDCETACHKCLKHYGNQQVHGMLDRTAAMELLQWGRNSQVTHELSFDKQAALFKPLESIVRLYGVDVRYDNGHILLDKTGMTKFITVYPAMRIEPFDEDTVLISDQQIKYAKPFAVKKIVDAFGGR